MSTVVTERDVYRDILQTYRYNPCLWDSSNKFYNDKKMRLECLEVLLEKLQILENDATIKTLSRKMDNMRSTFKKEHNKVKQSLRNATTPEEVYVPKLWYYDLLTFLDRDIPQSPPSGQSLLEEMNIKIVDVKTSTEFVSTEDVDQLSDHSSASPTQSPITPMLVRKRPRPNGVGQTNPPKRLLQVLGSSRSPPARLKHSAFGDHVAEKLRSMPPTASVFCQKLINDAIFMAEIDSLNATSRIVTNYPSNAPPSKW